MISAILKYSIGSLFYGGLITALFISLFIFLIKGWYKDAAFKPLSYVVLALLSVILLWNNTVLCCAMSLKSDISAVQELLERSIDISGLDKSITVDSVLSNGIFERVKESHPILGYYVDSCDFSGWSIAELPSMLCNTLIDELNSLILRYLLWSLGFVVVAATAVIKSMNRYRSGRAYSATGRYNTHLSRIGERNSSTVVRYGSGRRNSMRK